LLNQQLPHYYEEKELTLMTIEWDKKRGLRITDWAEKKKFKDQVKVLEDTIKWFKDQIEPHENTIYHNDGSTTIDGLKHRIEFLKKEARKSKVKAVF
jgi:predicted  nucleic acid-binding Zn-ribbon protein